MNPTLFYLPDGRLRPIWRFVISVFLFLASSFVALGLGVLLVGRNPHLLALVARPLLMVLLLVAYGWMSRVFDRAPRPFAAMGLPGKWRAFGDSLFGILLGIVMVVLTVVIIGWKGNLRITSEPHGVRAGTLLVEVLVVLSTAAMAEELAFRGYPFQRLIEATGAGGAIALMSALFGLIHLGNPNASTIGLLNTMLIGIVFSVAYLRSRTLWLPWGIHWAWNAALGAGIGLPVSGLDMSVGIRSYASGPLWLTGGAYGPEASLACTAAATVALFVILLAFRRPAETFTAAEDVTPTNGIQPM